MDDVPDTTENLYAAALELVTDCVLILDRDGYVLYLNRAASSMTGRAGATARGQHWRDVFSLIGDNGDATTPASGRGTVRNASTADALPIDIDIQTEMLHAPQSACVVTLRPGCARDVTPAHDTNALLATTYERGQIGFWEWDSRTGMLTESGYWVGKTMNTVSGSSVTDTVMLRNTHPDDVDAMQAALARHLRGETEYYEVEQRLRATNGSYIHFLVRGQIASRAADGQVLKITGTYVDVSPLRKQEAVLKFALESADQGVWEWDIEANVITEHGYWRPRLDSYDLRSPISGEAFGRAMHPQDRDTLYREIVRHLRAESTTLEVELRLRRRDRSWGDFLVRGRAMYRDANGRVARLLGTYTDISGYKSQERRLQVAMENARQGLWEWEPATDRLAFSREWYAMFDYPEGSFTSALNDLPEILHPDELNAGYAELVARLPHEGDEFELEHRLRHRDGHYIDILSRGRVIERDVDGQAMRFIGSHIDITDLKATQARVVESRRLLETVIDAFPQRLFWKDVDNHYLGCNRLFAVDAGVSSPADLVGKHISDIDWPDSIAPLLADDQKLLSSGAAKIVSQRRFRTVTGADLRVETTKVPIIARDGATLGILGIYDDVSARLMREEQLETIANAFTRTSQTRLLDALTEAAARLAGADYALVARLDASNPGFAKVTACYPPDSLMREHAYRTDLSPCSATLSTGLGYIHRDVCTDYPRDEVATLLKIEGYAGRRLDGASGDQIGLFVLMFRQPAPELTHVRAVLDVFAARAVAELDRELSTSILRDSEERLNAAVTGGEQGIWEWHLDSDRLYVFGHPFDGFSPPATSAGYYHGSELLDVLDAADRGAHAAALRAYLSGTSSGYEFEGRLNLRDDTGRWVLVRGHAVARDDDGRVHKMVGTLTDISAQKRIQSELKSSQYLLELVLNTVPQAIFWQDVEFKYLGCNQQFADLARVATPSALIGRNDDNVWWSRHLLKFRARDNELLTGQRSIEQSTVRLQRADGNNGWFELTKVPLYSADGSIIGIIGAVHDISVLIEAEEAAQRLALFDPLTNLPNRRYFSERLESALAAADRRGTQGALLFIDMDQFKQINDTLGHAVGDSLLQAVAQRLRNVTRQEDTVARLGGDEFVVLLPDIGADLDACAHQAQLAAEKIHRSLGAKFQIDAHQFHVTPTIGISIFPEEGKNVEAVLKEADTAMYSGKAAGRNVIRFFRREMEEATQQRLRIESEMRAALANEELRLYFQPQVDRMGSVSGAEVLLRWQHPTRGIVMPGEFIPIAEGSNLIVDIGHWVLKASFRALSRWLEGGIDIGELAINVSSRQFRAADFVTDVERLLVQYRVPAHRIVFEITESTVIESVETTVEIMTRLRSVGIRFAIDDFGIGYSSLSYLKRLPLDQVKIDRSFVADIGRDQNDEVICRTIIAMSQHLGLQTVAEGVETRQQYEFLSNLRCNGYQGYLFLAPSPEDEFISHLRALQDL